MLLNMQVLYISKHLELLCKYRKNVLNMELLLKFQKIMDANNKT